jgi:short-subunit dehydrogenase
MRFSGSNVAVVLFKVGPTKTRMTAAMNQKGFASPESVAEQIVNTISKNKSASVYVPGKWRLIMLVIKALPTALLAKLNL